MGFDNGILIAYGMCPPCKPQEYYQLDPEGAPTHFMRGTADEEHAQSYVHIGRRLDGLNELQWQKKFHCLLIIYLFSISRRRKLITLSDEINQLAN
jgi:hypothetical protein